MIRMLFGRDAEKARLDQLLTTGGALVLRGELGIGKTALLDSVEGDVLRVAGHEDEAAMPYAALHLLANRMEGEQASRLFETAEPDPFRAGLATLALLRRAKTVCLIDDAHWLDDQSARALAFAARRLEGTAIVFAALDEGSPRPRPEESPRPGLEGWPRSGVKGLPGSSLGGGPVPRLEGLPELRLGPLSDEAAAQVLDARFGDLARQVRELIVEEAGGNPLALRELSDALTAEQRVGRFLPMELDAEAPAVFVRRIRALASPARRALLVAASDSTGDLDVVLRAAGADLAAVAPAERAGLIRLSGRAIAFVHPLGRAAARREATAAERVEAHLALAESLEGSRATWHRAAAATGPDESVAAELEAAASEAADPVSAYERAAELSEDPGDRTRRLKAAAFAATALGQVRRGTALVDGVARLSADPSMLADVTRMRAVALFEKGSPGEAGRLLIEGAVPVVDSAPEQAAIMALQAVRYGSHAGDTALAQEAAVLLRSLRLPEGSALVPFVSGMAGLADFLAGGPPTSLASLRGLAAADGPAPQRLTAASLALIMGDGVLAERQIEGLEGVYALEVRAHAKLFVGKHAEAAREAAEGLRMAHELGHDRRVAHLKGLSALLAAMEGDEKRCRGLAEEAIAGGVATTASLGHWALGVLELALDRYETAFGHLSAIDHPVVALHAAPDLIEASVRSGAAEAAGPLLERFAQWAEVTARPWASAVTDRCMAMLVTELDARPDSGEELFVQALREHEKDGNLYHHARTHLAYGEWLRRAKRRGEAREQLRSALAAFHELGTRPWADRARAELAATGDPALPPLDVLDLTPQEAQVVRLAAQGLSNREIAARLRLSPRTVGSHLYRAYPKLGVSSRGQLREITQSVGTDD